MESRNNEAPGYLRSENDDISEDLAQSLPVDEPQPGNKELKDNGSAQQYKRSMAAQAEGRVVGWQGGKGFYGLGTFQITKQVVNDRL